MAHVQDNGTSPAGNYSTSTEAEAQTRPCISEISTNTVSLNLRDSPAQIDGPRTHNSMAQAKPITDTAMSSARPITDEASTFAEVYGKDFSHQAEMTTSWTSGSDVGMSTDTTSVKGAGSMTSPTRKSNTALQFNASTSSSATMVSPTVQDGGTSPIVTGSSTMQTQYESSEVHTSMSTGN